jgi:predicted transposase YbfD/YdcC
MRFYISSLPADAEMICQIARRHWGIENKLHWVLDVTFNEDKSCIRNNNATENVDIMRKWALNIINSCRKKDVSIKSMRKRRCHVY